MNRIDEKSITEHRDLGRAQNDDFYLIISLFFALWAFIWTASIEGTGIWSN